MMTSIIMTINRLKRAGFRVNAIHIGAGNPAMEYVSIVEPKLFGVPVVAVPGDAIAYNIDAGPVSLTGRNTVTMASITGDIVKFPTEG